MSAYSRSHAHVHPTTTEQNRTEQNRTIKASRAAFALAALLYLPQALAVIIGVRIPFTPQDPITPDATLVGNLQICTQAAADPAPIALGTAKAVNLGAGQTFAVDVQFPTDPIAPPQLYLSFEGEVATASGLWPAQLASNGPELPVITPAVAPLVPVGPLSAGLTVNLPLVTWHDTAGPLVVATTLNTVSPEPAPADRVLDDFRSGALGRQSIACGLSDQTRAGTMVGGTRRMRLIVSDAATACNAANPLRQPATLEVIGRTGPLVAGSGFKTFHRLELSWGQTLRNATVPLNLDLTGGGVYDRERLTFAGNDLVENVNLVLFTALNTAAASIPGCGINVQPGLGEFSIDFPFARLRAGAGVPDFADIDFLFLVLQSGSAIGANDFALKSLIATRGALPNVAECN